MKKIISLVLVLACMLSLLAGCSTGKSAETEAPEANDDKKVVGLSLYYRKDEYYVDIEGAMRQEAAKRGYDIIVSDADSDNSKQVQQLEDFIVRGVDCIIICTIDPQAIVPTVEDAVNKGIPVFTYDQSANTPMVTGHAGFDNYAMGTALAEWVINYKNEKLGGKANIAILDFPSLTIQSRVDGFLAGIEGEEGITIVSRQDGKAARAESMSTAENIMSSNDVDIFVCGNDESAFGAAAAIQAADKTAISTALGSWSMESMKKLSASDPYYAAGVIVSPYAESQSCFEMYDEWLETGKVAEPNVYVPLKCYDAQSITELDIEAIEAQRSN